MSRISDDWPFQLVSAGSFEVNDICTEVYKFSVFNEHYFITAGANLYLVPVLDFDISTLKQEFIGSSWITSQDFVTMAPTGESEAGIPTLEKRYEQITELALKLRPGEHPDILEGLYFTEKKKYVVLVRYGKEKIAQLISSDLLNINIAHSTALPFRRTCIGIGQCIEKGIPL